MNYPAASYGVSKTLRNEASFGEYNPERFKPPSANGATTFHSPFGKGGYRGILCRDGGRITFFTKL